MWQRNQPSNSSLVVPTRLHEGGPQTHVHSPRRQGQGVAESSSSFEYSAGTPGWTAPQTSSFLSSMPHTQSFIQGDLPSGGSGTDTNYTDPWNTPHSESSYIPSISNWPIPQLGNAGYKQPVDPSRKSYDAFLGHKASKADRKLTSSDSSMPDYTGAFGSNFDQINPLDQFDFQNTGPISKDHDIILNPFQVPNSTPTKWCAPNPGENSVTATNTLDGPGRAWEPESSRTQHAHDTPGMLHARKFTNVFNPAIMNPPPPPEFVNLSNKGARFPAELATSLTQSLLNQPSPLSVELSSDAIFPADEIKSRKENGLEDGWLHRNPSANIPPRTEMRKVSRAAVGQHHDNFNQAQIIGSNVDKGREKSSTHSPPSSARTFSAIFSHSSGSNQEFGHDLTNVDSIAQPSPDTSTPKNTDAVGAARLPSEGLMGPGSDKGTKRSRRQPTPANTKPLDDDGEQRLGTVLTRASCFDDSLVE